MSTVISVENLSKVYRLGQIGTGTFSHDLNLWWAKLRGKPNPLLKIGQRNHDHRIDETIWALKDISFQVEQGEVLGIIGRNGAGKSTLLKILSRVTAPTSGRIRGKGRIASLLEVGTGFHPELTGRENIYLNAAILGMNKQEVTRKFDEIVDFSGVEKFVDTPVKRYSSGMYVRLAFAVAAHLEPEILVVDEVLAVGDAEFQKKCLGKMEDVAKHGRTVLFVSHNMGAIGSLCGRCLLLSGGNLTGDGPTQSVITQYLETAPSSIPTREFEPIDSDAFFREICLVDARDNSSSRFEITETIKIVLDFILQRPIKGIEASISVLNIRGERLFYHSNHYADPEIVIEDAGIHTLEVSIHPMLLPPGIYKINAALHIPHVQMFDRRENAVEFEVIDSGSATRYKTHDWGNILVDLKWNKRIYG